jgi:hypothetical protein
MTTPDRVQRNRCMGLRVAVLFAIVLAALSWGEWALMGAAAAGGLVALVVYLRDCRGSEQESSQTEPHTRDSER